MPNTNTMNKAYSAAATQRQTDVLTAWSNGATDIDHRITLAAWHLANQEHGAARRIVKRAQRVVNANTNDVEAHRDLEAAQANAAVAKLMLDLITPLGKAARADVMLDYAAKQHAAAHPVA